MCCAMNGLLLLIVCSLLCNVRSTTTYIRRDSSTTPTTVDALNISYTDAVSFSKQRRLSSPANGNKRMPDHESWKHCMGKISASLSAYRRENVLLENRNLVVYHIGDLGLASNSVDIAVNNLQIFVNAIKYHGKTSRQQAFYLFNVVGGMDNPLSKLIPQSQPNVVILEWAAASSDLDTHLRTMRLLGKEITDAFSSVFFINQGVRGPLFYRQNGEWLKQFKQLMDQNNVAMLGPTLSCEVSPHVQTHMFALKSTIIPQLLTDMKNAMIDKKYTSWKALIEALEVGMTGIVRGAGYNVSSLLYYRRTGLPYFQDGHCMQYSGPTSLFVQNPTSWCGVAADETIFMKWGGEAMRTPGFMCNSTVNMVNDLMQKMVEEEPELQLILPEAPIGGMYYDLYKEYSVEAWRDRIPVKTYPAVGEPPIGQPKVCFMARAIGLENSAPQDNAYSTLLNHDIGLLVTTLRRQTNPNWLVFFYVVDPRAIPIEGKMKEILARFSDPRIFHVPIPENIAKQPFTVETGGYLATDYVLNSTILPRSECRYISLTVGDNAYGSEVVSRVLSAKPTSTATSVTSSSVGASALSSVVDMVIAPMDSRRFLEQDKIRRNRLRTTVPKDLWEENCLLLEASIELNSLTFPMRPVPLTGQFDAASVFLSRDKLLKEQLVFGSFSDINRYPLKSNITDPPSHTGLGRQASYLIEYLAKRRRWEYVRLPIDGLKSVVFHGNSPTLCMGGGNVWVDHVFIDQMQCLTQKEIQNIIKNPAIISRYHWEQFDSHPEILGSCLRLSQHYYQQLTSIKNGIPLPENFALM